MSGTEWHVWKPYLNEFSGNLAVCCSDERFMAGTLEFLRVGLSFERCDLVAVAGGPAFIVQSEESLMERLKLHVSAHRIQRIALLTHADCAYYQSRHKASDAEAVKTRQCEDACRATERLQSAFAGVRVEAFYATVDQWGFVFTPLLHKE